MRTLNIALCFCACSTLVACFGDIRRVPIGGQNQIGEKHQQASAFRPLLEESAEWAPYPIPYVDGELNFTPINHQTVLLDGSNSASGAYTPIDYDAMQEPWLSWQWSLQKRGDADYPFALLLGFDIPESQAAPQVVTWADEVEEELGIRPPLRAIAYVFGGRLPSDIAQSPFFAPSSIFTINLRGNIDCTGKNFTETRNVAHDYQALFHNPAPKASMLALVGDARGPTSSIKARFSSPKISPHTPALTAMHADPAKTFNSLTWGILIVAGLVSLTSGAWLVRRFIVRR